ncbi:MAG TPA: thioredoxin family protein [Vicinamibacterales bacterium]
MRLRHLAAVIVLAPVAAFAGQEQVIRVPLAYAAPDAGPKPNFSPKGTQVPLVPVSDATTLPSGAVRPAKSGVIEVGADKSAWIPVLATADPAHPQDLCRLYLDRNRNGRFDDEGPALTATPAQNEKTKAWWTSINKVELQVPYRTGGSEPYLVNFWMVRDGESAPEVLRYSVASWRTGKATVGGVDALVAAMDSNNDAIFDKSDQWSVLEASAPDAAKAVLSIQEARPTARMMYVKGTSREHVLEFRGFSPDGRWIEFARVDRPTTKAADRAGDDVLRTERTRPRATTPFAWRHDFDAALKEAKASGRRLLVDFEATWCGPCKTMDEWIWTDAEVAALLSAGYVGVKLDGDVEKAHVKRFDVNGYPTMIVVDGTGKEAHRAVGYLSSAEAIAFLKK